MEIKKLYYTMGELAEMFDVNASLIRHWEGQFDVIKPQRNKKGNRLFTQQDVDNFKLIYHLVKERGMTLDGAKKAMRKGSVVTGSSIDRDVKIMERLESLRSLLVEIRELLVEQDGVDGALSNRVAVPPVPTGRADGREPDAESRELFAFYEQRLF
ncbi:MAG: MerR family transcriptional regulator [Rikenellaceae bacterium]